MSTQERIRQIITRRKSQRAFTLIELLIVIALLLIIMLMIAFMFTSTNRLYNSAIEQNEVASQGRLALDQIEADLQGIIPVFDESTGAVTKDLILHSAKPKDHLELDSYTDSQNSIATSVSMGSLWQETKIKTNIENANENADEDLLDNLKPIIAFKTRTKWWDAEHNKFETGLAQVAYYIEKRAPYQINSSGAEFVPSTGYLMRLIIPIVDQTKIGSGQVQKAQQIRKEDICSSVLSVRVFALNHSAGVMNSVSRGRVYPIFPELDDRSQELTGSYIGKMRRGTKSGPGGGTQGQSTINPIQGLSFEFGSNAATLVPKNNEGLLSTVGNYPAGLMIVIELANDNFKIDEIDGEDDIRAAADGSVREYRVMVNLPAVEPASALPKDEIEKFENSR